MKENKFIVNMPHGIAGPDKTGKIVVKGEIVYNDTDKSVKININSKDFFDSVAEFFNDHSIANYSTEAGETSTDMFVSYIYNGHPYVPGQ